MRTTDPLHQSFPPPLDPRPTDALHQVFPPAPGSRLARWRHRVVRAWKFLVGNIALIAVGAALYQAYATNQVVKPALLQADAAMQSVGAALRQAEAATQAVQLDVALSRPFLEVDMLNEWQPDQLFDFDLKLTNHGPVPARFLTSVSVVRTTISGLVRWDHAVGGEIGSRLVFPAESWEIVPRWTWLDESNNTFTEGVKMGTCVVYGSSDARDTRRWVADVWWDKRLNRDAFFISKRDERQVKDDAKSCEPADYAPSEWKVPPTPPASEGFVIPPQGEGAVDQQILIMPLPRSEGVP
jgi:hypothetical protein